jgi:hypothetical protein
VTGWSSGLWSRLQTKKKKRELLIELTVPWETNILKDHAIKIHRYYELTNELVKNNYTVSVYSVEVYQRNLVTTYYGSRLV